MANRFGIYHRAGNVYEWCRDRYSGSWYSRPAFSYFAFGFRSARPASP